MAEFTTKQREKLAEEKEAMPDGSYPIRNRSDLKNAIQAIGRAKNPAKTKAWIKKRARELDAEDLIPESWLEHLDDDSEYLVHYGVMGMKWGVRKADRYQKKSIRANKKSVRYSVKAGVAQAKALKKTKQAVKLEKKRTGDSEDSKIDKKQNKLTKQSKSLQKKSVRYSRAAARNSRKSARYQKKVYNVLNRDGGMSYSEMMDKMNKR